MMLNATQIIKKIHLRRIKKETTFHRSNTILTFDRGWRGARGKTPVKNVTQSNNHNDED